MSKAFTKESDGALDEDPPVDDQALPAGVKNYLTPAGLAELRARIARSRESAESAGARRPAAERKLAALLRRLDAAEMIDPSAQPGDRVLFGATVEVIDSAGQRRRYRIVGIDEADPKRGWVSWRSPVARALLNARVGERASLHTPAGDEELEIAAISY